jgi:hypothetical protein
MSHSKLEVTFTHVREVTMSSRYNEADLILSGPWIPDLPKLRWQNLAAQSLDGRYVTLIAWDIQKNFDLGFNTVLIDTLQRTVRISPRIAGPCEGIRWLNNGFDLIVNHMVSLPETTEWRLSEIE